MLSVIPEDRSKDAWIVATWKQEWEASGPTRQARSKQCVIGPAIAKLSAGDLGAGLDKVKDDIKEKGLSAEDVYDRATWRRMSSYIDPT